MTNPNAQFRYVETAMRASDSRLGPNLGIPHIDRHHLPSFYIVAFIVFVGDSSRGILFPVLFSRCSFLGGGAVELGYLVATFSLGRLLMTTPIGYFCDMYRHRAALMITSAMLVLGAVLWANAGTLPLLFLAQFVIGVGSGSLGITRSFVVEQCPVERRTQLLSLLTALQYAGFTCSPFIGSGLSALAPADTYWYFSLPAYFVGLLSLYACVALYVIFRDISIEEEAGPRLPTQKAAGGPGAGVSIELVKPMPEVGGSDAKKEDKEVVPSRDVEEVTNPLLAMARVPAVEEAGKPPGIGPAATAADTKDAAAPTLSDASIVMLIMILLNITTKGSIAVFETLGAQLLAVYYSISSLNLGVIVSAAGAVGVVNLLLFKDVWCAYFTDVQLIQGGIFLMCVSILLILAYGGERPDVSTFLSGFILIYAVGYPIAHTACLGAFAKIQKSGRQATLMGLFATAGSLARIVLPIASSYLYVNVSYNGPFSLVLLLLTLSLLGIKAARVRIAEIVHEAIVEEAWKWRYVKLAALCFAVIFALSSFFFAASEAQAEARDQNEWGELDVGN